jgi:uncharacterized protein YfiM (DUF2279 family)
MGVVLAFALSLNQPADGPIGADKLKHFFLSAFVQSASYSALRLSGVEHTDALWGASGVTVGVGIAKEVNDARRGGRFDVGDLAWDFAGGAAAGVVLAQSRR